MSEWDEAKRLANLAKHGLDFVRADELFDGRPVLERVALSNDEPRIMTIGIIDGKYRTLIWTLRGNERRYISFRSARDEEKRQHRQLYQ